MFGGSEIKSLVKKTPSLIKDKVWNALWNFSVLSTQVLIIIDEFDFFLVLYFSKEYFLKVYPYKKSKVFYHGPRIEWMNLVKEKKNGRLQKSVQ